MGQSSQASESPTDTLSNSTQAHHAIFISYITVIEHHCYSNLCCTIPLCFFDQRSTKDAYIRQCGKVLVIKTTLNDGLTVFFCFAFNPRLVQSRAGRSPTTRPLSALLNTAGFYACKHIICWFCILSVWLNQNMGPSL